MNIFRASPGRADSSHISLQAEAIQAVWPSSVIRVFMAVWIRGR